MRNGLPERLKTIERSNIPRLRLRLIRLIRASSIAFLAPALLLAAELPPERTEWLMAETEHFTVLSDARPDAVESVARNLEVLHGVLNVMAISERRGPKTLVTAFRSTRTFQNYSPWPERDQVAGFFVPGLIRNTMSIDLSRDQRGSVVYHELLHEFASTNFPGVPLWFDEGLAEYYSSFALEKNQIQIGRPVENHVLWLRQLGRTGLLPVRDLLAVTHDSPEYNETQRDGRFYAQSWAAVHYLLTDRERASQLRAFLRALDSGQDLAKAFDSAFGMTFEDFDRALARYVAGRSFAFMKVPASMFEVSVDVRKVERSEALTRLAESMVAQAESAGATEYSLIGAREHAKAALAASPDQADALAVLGRLTWAAGDRDGARALFERASKDPAAVAARLYRGMLELDTVMAEAMIGAPNGQAEPGAVTARNALSEALALEPNWPKAQVSLGLTYLYQGDPADGLAVLRDAIALRPSDTEAWMGVAVLTAKDGRFNEAWQVIDRLDALVERTPQREQRGSVSSMARSSVALFEINGIVDLFNQGADQEAVELADAFEARLTPEELNRYRPHLDSVRTQLRQSRAVDALNEVIGLANAGRIQEALGKLTKVIESGDLSAELSDQAAQLKVDLKQRIDPR